MNKKNSIDKQIAIRQLIEKYTHCINHRKWDELPNIFATNATWKAIAPINLEFNGLDAITTRIPENVGKLEFLFQTSSEILITIQSENTADVQSQLTEVGRFLETGKGMHAIGSYEDLVIKENGIWKFLSRTFVLRYIDNEYPLDGEIVSR